MTHAFPISDEDVMLTMNDLLGTPCDINRASDLLSQIDQQRVEEAALWGNDLEEQTNYAHQDIRDQLVAKGLADTAVAEWVSSNFGDNFMTLDAGQKEDYRNRYVDSHQPQMDAPNNLMVA